MDEWGGGGGGQVGNIVCSHPDRQADRKGEEEEVGGGGDWRYFF